MGESILRSSLLSASSCLRVVALGGEPCPSIPLLNSLREPRNSTEFFNLYGTTEVSCWASCSKLDLTTGVTGDVPLGEPLHETLLEVRNGPNQKEGEIYIGSSTRVCQINGESGRRQMEKEVVWRATGDWATYSEGQLIFKHRLDSVVKHNGRKVDIQPIQACISELPGVQSCALHYQQDTLELNVYIVVREGNAAQEVKGTVLNATQQSDWKVPLHVFIVPELYITKHGKTDFGRLKMFTKCTEGGDSSQVCDSVEEMLQKLWTIYLGLESCRPTDNFLECGGDSVSAVQMTLNLEWCMKTTFPLLTDKLIHQSFSQVTEYCLSQQTQTKSSPEELPVNKQYPDNTERTTPEKKRRKTEGSCFFSSPTVTECFTWTSRGRKVTLCRCGLCTISACPIGTSEFQAIKFEFKESFRFDLSKCVDASPLLLDYKGGGCVICVGSHSGEFAILDLETGRPHWSVHLPDRIESSACPSPCGRKLFIGCYDHCLYCLNIVDGEKLWTFQSDCEIKSSPICSLTGHLVFVGSHDQHLYAVHTETGSCLWKIQVGQGSVFSSPAVSRKPAHVFAASLDGSVLAVEQKTGMIKWKASMEKPVFSSPLVLEERGVCMASVSGTVNHYDFDGQLLWSFKTDGPIFSTPVSLGTQILVANHSGSLYSISVETGSAAWKFSTASPIYAIPLAICHKNIVVTVSTEGRLNVILSHSGKEICSFQYPGQIFSSPVWQENKIIVGCRDNYVYCHAINLS